MVPAINESSCHVHTHLTPRSDKPADPEAAVLELNVRLPGDIFHTDPFYAGVLSPRAGYRTMKMAGSAINRTITQTKAAISILPPVSGHGSRLSKTGFLDL